jgi:hypothetical protein
VLLEITYKILICQADRGYLYSTMTNDYSIANSIPMNLEQMRVYLQELHGVPVVLREQGTTSVKCTYCGKLHEHGGPPGHYVALCDDMDRFNVGVVVGQRSYIPNYGYTLYDYRENGRVNELIHDSDMVAGVDEETESEEE